MTSEIASASSSKLLKNTEALQDDVDDTRF